MSNKQARVERRAAERKEAAKIAKEKQKRNRLINSTKKKTKH